MLVSQPMASMPVSARIDFRKRTAAAGEADDRNVWGLFLHAGNDGLSRGNAPTGKFVLGQAAGPAVENLQRPGACLDLAAANNRPRSRPGDRSGAGIHRDRDRPRASPRPDPCCRRPRPCRWQRSRARRKSRSPAHRRAGPATTRSKRLIDRSEPAFRCGVRSSRARSLPFRTGSRRGPSPSTNSTFCPRA